MQSGLTVLTSPLKHGEACVCYNWPKSCNHGVRPRSPVRLILFVTIDTIQKYLSIQCISFMKSRIKKKKVFAAAVRICCSRDGASISSMSLITQCPKGLDIIAQARSYCNLILLIVILCNGMWYPLVVVKNIAMCDWVAFLRFPSWSNKRP